MKTPPPVVPPAVSPTPDLGRITFNVLLICALIAASFWILRPFIGPGIWATMVVVATWPAMLKVQAMLGGRRWAAVCVMSGLLLLLFVVPLTLIIVTVIENSEALLQFASRVTTFQIPGTAPTWLTSLPLVGDSIGAAWARLAALGTTGLLAQLTPYAASATRWLVGEAGNLGLLVVQFLITVALAAVMYADGETWGSAVRRFGHRLGGLRGEGAVVLAGNAIRGVAMGVAGTAIVQASLAGLGMAVAGVPYAALLTAVALVMCIAQIGPVLVLGGAVAYLFWQDSTAWAVGLLVWTVFVGTLDNVLRPLLIRRGADLPLLLIFVGVIGGLLAFGRVGLFVGPVVLAVAYTLIDAWTREDRPAVTAALAEPRPDEQP